MSILIILLSLCTVSKAAECPANKLQLTEVHASSWAGDRVQQLRVAPGFGQQPNPVLQCGIAAAKRLLSDHLLVVIPGDGTQEPQCILANRSAGVCRRLMPTQQSPCCARVFVTSVSKCWISIQRRVDSSTDFYRNWTEYARGFGQGPHTNHWIGLRLLNSLTWPTVRALRVRMLAWNDTEFWADYSSFSVANESDKFRLSVLGFAGSHPGLGDSLAWHGGMYFSTFDSDNDYKAGVNCCGIYKGGWWYNACHSTNPNGLYFSAPAALKTPDYATGINWKQPFEYYYSLKEIELLIQ